MYITTKATFVREIKDNCEQTEMDNLDSELQDISGYQEIYDYLVEGGEITMYATFADECDGGSEPHGSHPYDCQRDCRYCDALDSWQEYIESEIEDITSTLEKELDSLEGYHSLEAVDD